MEARASGDIFLFEGFRLDRRGLCRRDDRGVFVPVVIGSRALAVLGDSVTTDHPSASGRNLPALDRNITYGNYMITMSCNGWSWVTCGLPG